MEEKAKPEEESSPAEDGSPLAPEPKRQRISGEEEDGGGAGGGGAEEEEEEDIQWEDIMATNATKDITALKAMEQNLKTNSEHLAQLEATFGPDEDYKKFIPALKKGNQGVLNGLSELIENCVMMLQGLIDEELANSSLPDDAEVDSPNK